MGKAGYEFLLKVENEGELVRLSQALHLFKNNLCYSAIVCTCHHTGYRWCSDVLGVQVYANYQRENRKGTN